MSLWSRLNPLLRLNPINRLLSSIESRIRPLTRLLLLMMMMKLFLTMTMMMKVESMETRSAQHPPQALAANFFAYQDRLSAML